MNAQDVLTLTLALGGTPEDADEIHKMIRAWGLRDQAQFALLAEPSAIARRVRGLLTQVRYERNGGRSQASAKGSEKRGGYSGARPASEMGPPAQTRQSSITTREQS